MKNKMIININKYIIFFSISPMTSKRDIFNTNIHYNIYFPNSLNILFCNLIAFYIFISSSASVN